MVQYFCILYSITGYYKIAAIPLAFNSSCTVSTLPIPQTRIHGLVGRKSKSVCVPLRISPIPLRMSPSIVFEPNFWVSSIFPFDPFLTQRLSRICSIPSWLTPSWVQGETLLPVLCTIPQISLLSFSFRFLDCHSQALFICRL